MEELLALGLNRGFITYDELHASLPDVLLDPDKLDALFVTLRTLRVKLLDGKDLRLTRATRAATFSKIYRLLQKNAGMHPPGACRHVKASVKGHAVERYRVSGFILLRNRHKLLLTTTVIETRTRQAALTVAQGKGFIQVTTIRRLADAIALDAILNTIALEAAKSERLVLRAQVHRPQLATALNNS